MSLTVGSLFAGIGGFDLGLERAGFTIKWQVEIDEYCNRVLAKHWPHIPKYGDIRSIDWSNVEPVDVLCGGFPCQDISLAGKRQGIEGERSGLWKEFHRAVRELRPRYVVVENVAALRGNGLCVVLADLAALGFDAEWDCITASAVGAPHKRDRVWIVAYAAGYGVEEPAREDRQPHGGSVLSCGVDIVRESTNVSDADSESLVRIAKSRGQRSEWAVEPDVGRVANGVPNRVDRLRALGNAVVPQIVEWLGRRILEIDRENLHRL